MVTPDLQTEEAGRPSAAAGSGPSAAVVAELRAALTNTDPWVRLHAVAGLARVDSDEAREGLVAALHDESFGVHWAAANALVGHGRRGVLAVLRAMLHDVPTTALLHGAARVLHHAALTSEERAVVEPVIDALHRPAADLEAPVLAAVALDHLTPMRASGQPERREPWWRVRRDRRGLRGHVFAPVADLGLPT